MEELIMDDDYFRPLGKRKETLEICVDSLIQLDIDEKEKLYRIMALIDSFEKDVRLDCGYRIVKMLSERGN